MNVVRGFSLLFTASLLGAVLLGSAASRPNVSADAASALADATGYFDSTVVLARNARPRGVRGDRLAISIGYIERLRLGLGSPFRLADEALHDPRLDSAGRSRAAWAVLGRLRRGDAYVVDASVFDGAGPWSADGRGTTGAAHLALIRQAVAGASDPRAGELAVRLAYSIASASGAISQWSVEVATQVAALLRDRESATMDLRDLLADANEQHADVMSLLVARRAAHGFRVERPPLAPLGTDLQLEAMTAVPALVRALDTLNRATHSAAPTPSADSSLLNRYFAERLRELGEQRPTLAPVAVTLRSRARASLAARNDETLAAASVLAAPATDSVARSNAFAMLSAAVSLRPLAQDPPWFPGDPGPTASDLTAEFGLYDVTFSRGVPGAWRPYYLSELQRGLRDMQSVLPSLSVDGLSVKFGREVLRDSALAMHDPRTRSLQLSVETSAGTIAHELIHDLDWQAARRLFADGGGYSTDRAMRERRGSLANSIMDLAEARVLRPGARSSETSSMGRPAELLARGADWLVASALADEGRSNGFLSVIQDGALGGYAAGAPALGLAGSTALVSALDEMTYVPDSTRRRFRSRWADPDVVDPALLVRRVLETPIVVRGAWRRPTDAAAGIVASTRARACVAATSPETEARRTLVLLAADARARGYAVRRARYRPLTSTPADVDRMREAIRAAILEELGTALPDQGLVPLVPAIFRSSAASCSATAR